MNLSDPPEKILDAIEEGLGLKRYGDVPVGRVIGTAFIAHGFHEHGQNCANELARFLGLLGIRCYSGRAFAPQSVSNKVQTGLAQYDVVLAIVTPQENKTWIDQEMAISKVLGKDLFILKQADVDFVPGILGDHEYIPFPEKELSKTFIPILEGLAVISGVEPSRPLFASQESSIELMEGNA